MKTSQKIARRLIGIGVIGVLAIFYGPLALDEICAAFPGDPLHAAALRDCAAVDHAFNRLDQEQRADCYAEHLLLMGDSSVPQNEVDLAVSAARNHQSKTDVVQQQQLARYLDARDPRRVQKTQAQAGSQGQ
jgi:hypothetical protein